MIMTTFANVFFTVCSFFLLAFGGPVPRKALDVYVPPITYPHAGTVWIVGEHHNVTWNTNDAPVNITNSLGHIILATNGIENYTHPLASGFSILDGRVVIQVPDVPTGDDYAIVLFGDSGNFSPTFTITAK